MKDSFWLRVGIVAALLSLGGVAVPAQGLAGDPVLAARDEVVAELVQSLPATLPQGALAILPPETRDPDKVNAPAATTWATAVAEAVHRERPDVALVDRENLTAILREQKLGDSAYADPATAVKVGHLVAARMLLLTGLHELRLSGGQVRVSLEATLVDVETGEDLWSKAVTQGIFPFWAKLLIALALAMLVVMAWRAWRRHQRVVLVTEEIPREKGEARVDVDGLARAAVEARERLRSAGATEAAEALQRAWVDLDAALDRVRHALPGGAVERNRVRDLKVALRDAEVLANLVSDLRRACDRTTAGPADREALARRLATGASEVRAATDAFRRHMV